MKIWEIKDNFICGRKTYLKYGDKSFVLNMDYDNLKEFHKNKRYLINTETGEKTHFDSFDDMLDNFDVDGKPLRELTDDMEITGTERNDKKEFLSALAVNHEIEFSFEGTEYFKGNSEIDGVWKHAVEYKDSEGKWHIAADKESGELQAFDTVEELEEKCCLNGMFLRVAWDRLVISCIL